MQSTSKNGGTRSSFSHGHVCDDLDSAFDPGSVVSMELKNGEGHAAAEAILWHHLICALPSGYDLAHDLYTDTSLWHGE
eukprot:6290477-Amphidinium_carterae.2